MGSPYELYAAETAVIGCIVRKMMTTAGHVTNRATMQALVNGLERSNNPFHLNVLRNCLQIVVGQTPDELN
jgi:hypothetical protein